MKLSTQFHVCFTSIPRCNQMAQQEAAAQHPIEHQNQIPLPSPNHSSIRFPQLYPPFLPHTFMAAAAAAAASSFPFKGTFESIA